MNEDQLKAWLEALEEDEVLIPTIELNQMNESVDADVIKRIKCRTFEKVRKSKKLIPFKAKRRWVSKGLVAVLILCLIPMTGLAVHYRYHFIPRLGEVIETNYPIFTLSEAQSHNEAVLTDFIYMSGKQVKAMLEIPFEEGANLQTIESDDIVSTLSINGRIYEGKAVSFTIKENDEGSVVELNPIIEFNKSIPEYHLNDEIVLEVKIGNRYVYSYTIIGLENTVDAMSYEGLGSTSTKRDISITAVSIEDEGSLNVTFVTPSLESSEVMAYNKYPELIDKVDEGVYLKDANGQVVKGEVVCHQNQCHQYQFKTEGLKKPYQIQLASIIVSRELPKDEPIYTLNIPDYEAKSDKGQTFTVNGFAIEMTPITLKDGPKDEFGNLLNEGDNFTLEVKVNQSNFNSEGDRLIYFSIEDTVETDSLFLGYQTTGSPIAGEKLYEIYLKEKASVLNFRFTNMVLEINGDWEFFIE